MKGQFTATEKQLVANRANAQLSSGPATSEGKAASSHNAVKTGLTGQTVLLETDDVEAYNKHIQRFTRKFEPKTDDESALVQDLADTEWRLLRITPLEAGIYAVGRIKLAPMFEGETELALRDQLLEAEVFLAYRKDFSNLSLQQTRLRKHRSLVTEELTKLQQDRKALAQRQAKRAAEYYSDAIRENWSFTPADFGFEFAFEDMIEILAAEKALSEADAYPEVTKKTYRKEFRSEYTSKFVEK